MNEKLEAVAKGFESLASELESAVAHAKIAATHFRSQEVPRGCAHAVAVQGCLAEAQELMNEFMKAHRESARKV